MWILAAVHRSKIDMFLFGLILYWSEEEDK
jgi:hypothetical protein